jgi:predicted metal-dependent hydrolase
MSGVKEFINTLKNKYFYLNEQLFEDLTQFIINSGCPSIRFDYLSLKALGVSKTDECIISYKVLDLPIDYVLYIILHEVAHQYQYKKYGKNMVLEVYKNEITIDTAIEKLLYFEKQADRLAIKKLNSIVKKSNTKIVVNIIPRYLNMNNFDYIRGYIQNIRSEVTNKNYTTIESINDYIHDSVKIKLFN